jgi:hypothetical protein
VVGKWQSRTNEKIQHSQLRTAELNIESDNTKDVMKVKADMSR